MFKVPFHIRLKDRRTHLGYTQRKLADSCGLSPGRISNLERGLRNPTVEECRLLDKFLSLGTYFVAPREWYRQMRDNAASHSPRIRAFAPTQDRPTFIRYRACCNAYPFLTKNLLESITARQDFVLCECICHQIPCESALEALFLLYLLARNAKPGFLQPSSLGRTPHPIVDDRGREEIDTKARSCLILDSRYYFFQVSFAVGKTVRVDVLRWDEGWSVIELNGPGHDERQDPWKGSSLELPVHYVSESELVFRCQRLEMERAA